MTSEQEFKPNWMSSPGDTIADILQQRGLSAEDLSDLLGYSQQRTNKLLCGRTAVTRKVAKRLEHTLGGSERFWLMREDQYRGDVAHLQSKGNPIAARLWLNELPRKDMVEFGWIGPSADHVQQLTACLRFFDVRNVSEWRKKYHGLLSVVAFRASATFDSQPGAVLAWLRYAELKSTEIKCAPWQRKKLAAALPAIRGLTRRKDPRSFLPELRRICAECGVAVVVARTPKGCRASGATRFLSPNKAIILLSFRYMSDDQFWFTFFHECGHLLLHSQSALFLEDGSEVTSEEEQEANRFAEKILIPDELRSELSRLRTTQQEIMRFSVKAGVSRGIILGQLQHMGRVKHDRLNWLKRRYSWDMIEN